MAEKEIRYIETPNFRKGRITVERDMHGKIHLYREFYQEMQRVPDRWVRTPIGVVGMDKELVEKVAQTMLDMVNE